MPNRFEIRPGPNPSKRANLTRKNEMPKLKTKSSAKKRFRLTGTGKVRGNVANKSHGMSKRPQNMKRKARGTMILSDADARIVKSYLPYG
jgi:large subunit ribosomal protein L35